jgi:hypothetical protein
MKAFLTVLALSVGSLPCLAQSATGSPSVMPLKVDDASIVVYGRTDVINENSPYRPSDDWQRGYFIQQNGKRFEQAEMRFDTYNQRLEYREDGKIYAPKEPIVRFGFANGDTWQNQFPPFDRHDSSTFFQILYGGNTRLIKYTMSTVSDVTPYNSATKVMHFNEHTTYYILSGEQVLAKIKKLDDSLLTAFGPKQAEVRTYMKANNLTWKDPAALNRLMSHYDSL